MKNSKEVFWSITGFVSLVLLVSLLLLTGVKSIPILLSLGVFALIISFRYPRLGFVLFLCYLPWAGTLIYSVGGMFVSTYGEVSISGFYYFLFQLSKDFFYFPALASTLLLFRGQFQKYTSLSYLFLGLSVCCLLTFLGVNVNQGLLNGQSEYLAIGIIGLKTILGYIPLVFCAYFWLRTKEDLFFLMRMFTVLIILACLLCFIQYFLLNSGVCLGSVNLPEPASTRASLQARCFVGGSLLYNPGQELLRLPGTFASPWHWAWFLISSAFLSYGIILIDPALHWRIIGTFTVLLVFMTSVISGQRTSLLLVPIIFIVLVIITERKVNQLIPKLGLIICLSVISFSNFDIFQERLQNLANRWNYSSPIDFVSGQFAWLLNGRLSLLGEGIGKATSGSRLLGGVELIETFHVKVLYEIGILGGLTYFALMCVLLIVTFKAYQSLKDPKLRQLSLCLWSFLLLININPYYYPLAVDPVNVYYWLIGGLILKLPEIESTKKISE